MKRYRFLLFDLDYTLLDFDADMNMAFEKLYTGQGWGRTAPYSPAMLDLYEKHNAAWWRKFEGGECSKPELFRGRFVDFLRESGLSGDPDELNEAYFRFLGTGGVPYPGALELLERLRASYQIYVVTNGYAESARTRINNSGVGALIEGYFVSDSIGFAKPDKRYFDYVFSHIPGFEKDRALVIGDSPVTDVQGAKNAGVDSLWYHAGSGRDGRESPADYEARSYQEILRILEGENG